MHLNDLPDKQAFTVAQAFDAGWLSNDGYHDLAGESAKKIPEEENHAEYACGWNSSTLWMYEDGDVTVSFFVAPFRGVNGQVERNVMIGGENA